MRGVFVVAVLAAVATGCGGSQLSKDEYGQELEQASSSLTQASQDLGRELTQAVSGQGSYAQAATEMGTVREQLDETANQLDDLSPPEDTAPVHDRLVDALRAYSDDLRDIQSALESGNGAEIARRLRGAASLQSMKDLQKVATDLRELGYSFET
jgi:ABC-type transporter Mla subunit MlaD